MKSTVLPGTGIVASRLGFGCGRLMRSPRREERQGLLHAAFDAGIRYFDVARMYGLGQAEAELGRFLRGRRSEVVVASKFGIAPRGIALKAGGLQRAGRAALRAIPALKPIVARRAASLYRPAFDPASAKASLAESLRQLGTDYLDLLFLHEPTPDQVDGPALSAWLDSLVAEGVIRQYGVAGDFGPVMDMLRSAPSLCRVLQFDSNVLTRNIEALAAPENRAVINFAVLPGALAKISGYLDEQPDARDAWSRRLALDFRSDATLPRLLLGYALHRNPAGVVLFSSSRTKRVSATAELIDNPPDVAAVEAFLELLAGAGLTRGPVGNAA